MKRPAATIALVTFVVLVLELTSVRLYAYIGSSHATATALSIALLGLSLGAFLRLRFARFAAAPRLALALLVLAGAVVLGAPLPVLVALSLAPFACAGMLVSAAYAARGSGVARASYAVDLVAAAAGCLVAPRLIGPLSPTEIIALLGVACCGLVERRGLLALLAVAHLAVFVTARADLVPDGPLRVLLASDPQSEKAIAESRTTPRDIVDSAWSPLGRLDVRRFEDRRGMFTDGMSPTYLVTDTAFEDTWGLLMSLPYRALRPQRVLLLGAGAGASVWLAKKYGAARVDAVEVNPALPDVLARQGATVYQQPGVALFVADARRHLTDTGARYDLIELALALTGNVHAEQPSGMEAHLYTVEAVELYLRRLAPGGVLSLIHSDPGNAYRQLLTVLAALERLGVPRERALEGIVVLHDPTPATAYRYLLVVRASPMPLDLVEGFDVAPAELLWGPGDPPDRAAQLLDPARVGATARDDFFPVHDDRPYFFQNTKGLVATLLAEPGRLWVLAGALVLVVVLVLERRHDTAFVRPAAVATGLGIAYITVELALIQRFTLAAGGTLYAVSFVLFSLLASSAAGALTLGGWLRRRRRGVAWACLGSAVVIAATALLVRDLAWLDAIASDAVRLLIVVALVIPTGLAIGCPFPLLLGGNAARIANLWAINGAASVAGGIVAVLALRVAGATDALYLAAGLYAACAALDTRDTAA